MTPPTAYRCDRCQKTRIGLVGRCFRCRARVCDHLVVHDGSGGELCPVCHDREKTSAAIRQALATRRDLLIADTLVVELKARHIHF